MVKKWDKLNFFLRQLCKIYFHSVNAPKTFRSKNKCYGRFSAAPTFKGGK